MFAKLCEEFVEGISIVFRVAFMCFLCKYCRLAKESGNQCHKIICCLPFGFVSIFFLGRANMATEQIQKGRFYGGKAHCEGRIFHVTYLYHCQLISQADGGPVRNICLFLVHISHVRYTCFPFTAHCSSSLFVLCFCGMFAPFCVFVYV